MTCECCLGACCTGYDCQELSKAACDDLGGEWQGAGTTCSPDDPCIGACCDSLAPEGDPHPNCTDDVYEDDCTSPSVWIKGAVCAEEPCYEAPAIVRCCLSDGTCDDTSYTAAQCVSAGGTVSDAESCTPNPCCIDDDDCAACECCGVDGCEAAVCQEPVIDIDTWSWCGGNLGTGAVGVEPLGDVCFEGSVECEDPAATYTFRTRYYFEWSGLIETVTCGGTQTTSPGSFPSIPSGHCRYIYRMGGGFGQSSTLADSCKARYWWGYVDVDPCEAPASGSLTMVEDTAAAVNNSAISDCTSANTPGCRTGCDTDIDDCFSTTPSIPINPAP